MLKRKRKYKSLNLQSSAEKTVEFTVLGKYRLHPTRGVDV